MSSYLITGASRGIGLELTKQLLALPTSQVSKVFAVSRSKPNGDLQQVLDQNKDRVVHVTAAVDDQAGVKQAVTEVEKSLAGKGLDVLINNAGITFAQRDGIENVPVENLTDAFKTNVAGVHIVTAALLPLLRKGNEKKVINVASTLGSIAWSKRFHSTTPTPAYKISKAALNMMHSLYSLQFADEGFTFVAVSPGWLKTDLGSQYADLDVSVGVKEVIRITQEANPSVNGKFFNINVPGWEKSVGQYDGGEIPW